MDPDPLIASDSRGRLGLWPLVYGVGAILFNVAYWRRAVVLDKATLETLTAFKATTPFQYRVLIPALAHGIEGVATLPLRPLYFFISTLATFALVLAYRGYLRRWFTPRMAGLLAAAILYPLAWNYCLLNVLFYPSDIPAILFFVLGLGFLLDRRWALFYATFAVATLNRETSCFLSVAMLALYWDSERPKLLVIHLAAQAAIWLAIELALRHCFAGNPGSGAFETHVHDNLNFLRGSALHPRFWNLSRLLVFGGAWVFVPLAWRRQPAALRRLLIVAVPFVVGMAVVGVLSEVRIYGELIPIVLTPALYGLYVTLFKPTAETTPTPPAASPH